MAGEFIADVEQIRKRAREQMDQGAVTGAYRGDVKKTIEILNSALATEIVCVLRYRHHYYMASGLHGDAAAEEFLEHANNEQQHADSIAERIQQLGGVPDMNPATVMARSFSQYVEGESLEDMIREDLVAERVVIEVYNQMIRYFEFNDITTREMLEDILKDEEEHASDLSDLFFLVNPRTGKSEGQDPALETTKGNASEMVQKLRGQRGAGETKSDQRTGSSSPPRRAEKTPPPLNETKRRRAS